MRYRKWMRDKRLLCPGLTVFLLFMGLLLGVWKQEEPLSFLERPGWGEGEEEKMLLVERAEGEPGEIKVTVKERFFTPEEIERFLNEAESYIKEMALGENKGWDKITENLNLISKVPEFSVDIYWDMGEEEFFDRQGKLCREHIPKEGADTVIAAVLLCQECRRDVEIPVHIQPPMWTKEELWQQNVENFIQQKEREEKGKTTIGLPGTFNGEKLAYYEQMGTGSKGGEWILFSLAAGGILYAGLKKEEKEKKEKQRRQLLAEYPGFVEKLLLYMGAGMSIRNIFFKLKTEEQDKLLGEELAKSCRQLKNGESEGQVYREFGEQIGLLPFIRLGGLLSQNLRSGTREIMDFLEREVEQSFYERKAGAKKRGEEIGVKLLFPMGLLLFLTLAMIMVPAFLQF